MNDFPRNLQEAGIYARLCEMFDLTETTMGKYLEFYKALKSGDVMVVRCAVMSEPLPAPQEVVGVCEPSPFQMQEVFGKGVFNKTFSADCPEWGKMALPFEGELRKPKRPTVTPIKRGASPKRDS